MPIYLPVYTADQVADTLIYLARQKNIEVSNLKLQKLLYYAQAWSLALHQKPLFDDDFEAWVHGPVVPKIFRRFKAHKWNPIVDQVNPVPDPKLQNHLQNVLDRYGSFTPNQLERLTHSEGPWKDARKGLEPDVSSAEVITKQSMKTFYSGLLHAKNKRSESR